MHHHKIIALCRGIDRHGRSTLLERNERTASLPVHNLSTGNTNIFTTGQDAALQKPIRIDMRAAMMNRQLFQTAAAGGGQRVGMNGLDDFLGK